LRELRVLYLRWTGEKIRRKDSGALPDKLK
jgi:hypothetical protein